MLFDITDSNRNADEKQLLMMQAVLGHMPYIFAKYERVQQFTKTLYKHFHSAFDLYREGDDFDYLFAQKGNFVEVKYEKDRILDFDNKYKPLKELLATFSIHDEQLVDLLRGLLNYDPSKRLTPGK